MAKVELGGGGRAPTGRPRLHALSLTTAAHPPQDSHGVPPPHGAERDTETQNSAGLCLLLTLVTVAVTVHKAQTFLLAALLAA